MPEQKLNNARSLVLPLLMCGVLLIGAGLAYWYLTPKTYRTAARLRVVDWVTSANATNVTDLSLVLNECDVIRSNIVMDQAIQAVHLNELWGKKFNQGKPLTAEETRNRLRAFITVRPLPNSSVIELSATGTNTDDTANIINALATAYRNFSISRRSEQIQSKLDGLNVQWDGENEKIRTAQTKVDELYFQITRERSSNTTQFYDTDAYDLLLAKRAELKTKFVEQQSQLAGLKKLDHEQLKDVLSSMDANSPLTPTMLHLSAAKTDLFKARSDHGDNSSEVRNATVAVDKLTEQLGREVDAAMTVRETQLTALQTTLSDLETKIQHANTNAPKSTIQDTNYQAALAQLKQHKSERDDLQKLMSAEKKDAMVRTGIIVDIIESADTPSRPFMPDPKIAIGAVACGGVGVLAAFAMLLVSLKPKPPARPRPLQ